MYPENSFFKKVTLNIYHSLSSGVRSGSRYFRIPETESNSGNSLADSRHWRQPVSYRDRQKELDGLQNL